jgi:hypothetical protein
MSVDAIWRPPYLPSMAAPAGLLRAQPVWK